MINNLMTCQIFPIVVGGWLKSIIFSPVTGGHLPCLGRFLHFGKTRAGFYQCFKRAPYLLKPIMPTFMVLTLFVKPQVVFFPWYRRVQLWIKGKKNWWLFLGHNWIHLGGPYSSKASQLRHYPTHKGLSISLHVKNRSWHHHHKHMIGPAPKVLPKFDTALRCHLGQVYYSHNNALPLLHNYQGWHFGNLSCKPSSVPLPLPRLPPS
jgi:hypothetical protein